MRLIFLEFDKDVKIPNEADVIRTNNPRGFEKIMFIVMRIRIIIRVRVL